MDWLKTHVWAIGLMGLATVNSLILVQVKTDAAEPSFYLIVQLGVVLLTVFGAIAELDRINKDPS